jgi:hypothetical protein
MLSQQQFQDFVLSPEISTSVTPVTSHNCLQWKFAIISRLPGRRGLIWMVSRNSSFGAIGFL